MNSVLANCTFLNSDAFSTTAQHGNTLLAVVTSSIVVNCTSPNGSAFQILYKCLIKQHLSQVMQFIHPVVLS